MPRTPIYQRATAVGLLAALTLTAAAPADDDLGVLTRQIDGEPAHEMMHRHLMGRVDRNLAEWRERYEQRTEPDAIEAYQKRLKEKFLDAIGGLPERTPLKPRITGTVEKDGYTVEKIIFESRPGHYVTAALFLPDEEAFEPPYPGVLVPCGHSHGGKANEGYQKACALMARNGLAALIFDPIEQGERMQLIDDEGNYDIWGTRAHSLMNLGSALLGRDTAHYRIWDGIRGIDYLQSREEVDAERIGCAGNSGGGTQTAYLMALDERIDVAVPSCYITSFDRLLNTIGPQDAEQNIYGQLSFGMDHADYIMMRAPKPTLICCATRDFFDITGTWNTFRDAKRLYSRMGHAGKIDLIENDATHGFKQPLRERAVSFLVRWLRNENKHITEPDGLEVLSDEEIRATPDGQVMLLDGARSTYDINRTLNDQLAEKRRQRWSGGMSAELREKVRELARIRPADELPDPDVERLRRITRDGVRITQLLIRPEEGIVLPAVELRPRNADDDAAPLLIVHENGKAEALREGLADAALNEGRTVLAVDLRGTGETKQDRAGKFSTWLGTDTADVQTAYLLGDSYVGMRAEDVLSTARWLGDRAGEAPELIAVGHVGVPALHAAALEPGLFDAVQIEDTLISWSNVLQHQLTYNQYVNVVHGALRVYDLPDLVASLGDQLTITHPTDAQGEPVDPERAASD